MSGALNSGMDVLIELSAGFLRRVVRKKLQEMDQGCFQANGVAIPDPRDPDGTPLLMNIRRAQIDLAELSFEQTLGGPVRIGIEIELLYAQVQWLDGSWPSLDELEDLLGTRIARSFSANLPLTISADSTNILLSVDTSGLSYLPPELSDPVAIPVTFLDQISEWVDDAGTAQSATLLALTISGQPEAKVLNAETLVIALDVELTQDDPIRIPGPQVPRTNPIVAADDELVSHNCGLPHQPGVDRLTFVTDFVDSFGQGHDWAVALDAHILDAILRGLPSAGINDEGEETDDCPHEDAIRSACIQLNPPLEEDLIRVSGHGQVYVCRPEFFIDNGYYATSFLANVTLSIEGNWVRAHYEVTDVSLDVLGPDATDVLLWIADEEIDESDDKNAFRARFGSSSDAAGRLTVENLNVQSDGVVLRGSSSIQPGYRSIAVRDVLLFAKGCGPEDEPVARGLRIRNNGNVNLHVCPLGIRRHPDGSAGDVGLFAVTAPVELVDSGDGMTLAPGESVVATIECSGAAGAAYVAWLDIPNDAEPKSVKLDANFQPATLGPLVSELAFDVNYAWSGCNRPGNRTMDIEVELTNEGPGNLRLCRIAFSDELVEVFEATDPGVFAPGPAHMTVSFHAPWGIEQEYEGRLQLRTNGGERVSIDIVAHASTEQDPFGVFNHAGFDRDMACGDADWDRVQDTGGAILDEHEVAELLPILGGEPCCPPPRGPACQCVDLWETTFFDMPAGVGLEVVSPAGQTVARSFASNAVQTLLAPMRSQGGYTLRASLPDDFAARQVSRMSMRRWLLQQDGLYTSNQRISDVTVAGDFAYLAGRRGLEIVRLTDPQRPERVRVLRSLAGASGITALDEHLLILADRLFVYSLANPARPRYTARLRTRSRVRALLVGESVNGRLAYGLGKRLHVLDFGDFDRPRELDTIPLRAHATRGACKRGFLYVFSDAGLEIFSIANPSAPQLLGFHSLGGDVKNAFVSGNTAVVVKRGGGIDILDVSNPPHLRPASELRLEDWMRDFVPCAGSLPRYRSRFLMLTSDQQACRILRVRPNRVDQEKLRRWRATRGAVVPRD